MRRPRLLDLCCCGGGAAVGFHRAGWEVVGVDVKRQPRYPFRHVVADALEVMRGLLEARKLGGLALADFDGIHAAPPCQRFTRGQNAAKNAAAHPDLVTPLRPLLEAAGLPYVMENVVGAPLVDPTMLCGTMFGLEHEGFELRRHRLFETNWLVGLTPSCAHRLPAAPVFGHSAGRDWRNRHGRDFSAADKAAIMGIDWLNRNEVAEAIPPAFAEFIGRRMREACGV